MRIERIKLLSNEIDELKVFYTDVLGCSIQEDFIGIFTVKVGQSYLTFEQTSNTVERPFYHFAFDIPGQ